MKRTNLSLIAFALFGALLFASIFVIPPHVSYLQSLAILGVAVVGMGLSAIGALGLNGLRTARQG